MLLVPAPTTNAYETRGAMRVISRGRFRMSFAATWTSQSIPPAACMAPAAVTTARMMSMALPGTEPGGSPKMNIRTKTPTPPQMPRPMPPIRTPMMRQTTTTRNSRINVTVSTASPPVSRVAPTGTYHAAGQD